MQNFMNTTLMAKCTGPSFDLSCQLVDNNKGSNMKGVNAGNETVFVTTLIQTFGSQMMASASNTNIQQQNNYGHCINGLYLNSKHGL
jgi:hypothetical protein